jgi:hypothetical protein
MISKFLHRKERAGAAELKSSKYINYLMVSCPAQSTTTVDYNIFKSPNQFGAVVYFDEEPRTGFSSIQTWNRNQNHSKSFDIDIDTRRV